MDNWSDYNSIQCSKVMNSNTADIPEKCEDVQCDNGTETCLEVENKKMKMAVCIPARELSSLAITTIVHC